MNPIYIPIDVFSYTVTFPFIIVAIAAVALFNLDGKSADAFMLSSLSLSLAIFLYSFIEYIASGLKTLHIVLLRSGEIELFGLIVDPISMLIGFVVWTAGFAFMLYSVAYMTPENREHPVERGKGRFYGWMMLFIAATVAFVFSSTLLQLLIFFELMTLSCWGVIAYYGEPQCYRAALKAFITTHLGALLGLFIAIAVCFGTIGSVSLYDLKNLPSNIKLIVFLALLASAITKSSQFPTYSWLPDAMVAPTPATAFLHGAAMIEMGVYLLARGIQFLLPLPIEAYYVLLTVVSLTLIVTALMYVVQRDSKRLLAYSTIAESASMYAALVAACLGIIRGIYVSMYILALHAYVKGLGFLTTGIFSYYMGGKTIDVVRGLLRANGFTAFCWVVSLFGLAGLPPMPLFFAKLMLFTVLIEALLKNPYTLALILALLADLISFGIVAARWIHATVIPREAEVPQFRLNYIFTASLSLLLILLFIIPYISEFIMYVV